MSKTETKPKKADGQGQGRRGAPRPHLRHGEAVRGAGFPDHPEGPRVRRLPARPRLRLPGRDLRRLRHGLPVPRLLPDRGRPGLPDRRPAGHVHRPDPLLPGEQGRLRHRDRSPAVGATIAALYPEIFKCVGCGTCTRSCPMDIDVLGYVSKAIQGDITAVAEGSFDCVMCGLCAARCPAEEVQYNIAILARRLYARHLAPKAQHLAKAVEAVEAKAFDKALQELKKTSVDELKKLYKGLEIEPDMAEESWSPKDTVLSGRVNHALHPRTEGTDQEGREDPAGPRREEAGGRGVPAHVPRGARGHPEVPPRLQGGGPDGDPGRAEQGLPRSPRRWSASSRPRAVSTRTPSTSARSTTRPTS